MQLFIGCGTGRCGSASLAALLDGCVVVRVTHEMKPVLPWQVDQSKLANRVLRWRGTGVPIVGDVASWNLNYIEPLMRHFPALRVICLERPKAEVVESWERKWGAYNLVQHPMSWQAEWHTDEQFDDAFPKFYTDSRREALELYWHYYREEIRRLQLKHPHHVAVFDMAWALNTQSGQDAIFDHVGIVDGDRAYRVGEVVNPSAVRSEEVYG